MKQYSLIAALLLVAALPSRAQNLRMLVGTYEDASTPNGALLYRFDAADGSATLLAAEPQAPNCSFVIPSADGTRAWACREYNDGRQGAYALRIGEQAVERIGLQSNCPDGAGNGDPCNILYLDGYVLLANYSGGSVSVFPVAADGTLEPLRRSFSFGERSRMHCCALSPDGKFVFASDLGCDALRRFPVLDGDDGPLGEPDIAYQAAPGSGPRHFVFSADGRFCYLLGELGDTLTVLRYEDGTLTPVQELKAYRGRGKGSADIHLSPDGRFLYTSHRLRKDGIAVFRVDAQSGKVRRAGFQRTGTHPRNFALSPDGRWLLCACRDSHCIEIYARNVQTGKLLPQPERTIRIGRPVCVQFF